MFTIDTVRQKVYLVNDVDGVSRIPIMLTLDTLSSMPRKPIPASEKKVGLAARIDPQLLVELTRLAELDDRTLSYMVEKAVREFVEKQSGKSHRGASKR